MLQGLSIWDNIVLGGSVRGAKFLATRAANVPTASLPDKKSGAFGPLGSFVWGYILQNSRIGNGIIRLFRHTNLIHAP